MFTKRVYLSTDKMPKHTAGALVLSPPWPPNVRARHPRLHTQLAGVTHQSHWGFSHFRGEKSTMRGSGDASGSVSHSRDSTVLGQISATPRAGSAGHLLSAPPAGGGGGTKCFWFMFEEKLQEAYHRLK